jgi:hypothetical protein
MLDDRRLKSGRFRLDPGRWRLNGGRKARDDGCKPLILKDFPEIPTAMNLLNLFKALS